MGGECAAEQNRNTEPNPELSAVLPLSAKMKDRVSGGLPQNAYPVLEVTGAGETPRVIFIMASLLERLVTVNDASKQCNVIRPQGLAVFHGLRAPSISIDKYLDRISKYANCSPSCFVVAYAYIDRFVTRQPGALAITSLNVHRLLITSIMVAAKFMDDAYYNNAYYAKVGGITTMEMNRLELEFLFRLGFRLQITVSAFESYCSHLEREMVLCDSFRVERPILLYACGNSGQDKTQKHPHHHQQQQRMAVWQSYAGV